MSLYTVSFSQEKRVQSVISEGGLTIKALSLPAGESLKRHQTGNILFLQCLEGNPVITIYGTAENGQDESGQDETVTLSPSMLLRIEANRPHAVDAGESDALLLLHLLST